MKKTTFILLVCIGNYSFAQELDDWKRYSPFEMIYHEEMQSKFTTIDDYLYQQHDTIPYRTAKKYPVVVFNTSFASPRSWLYQRQSLMKEPTERFKHILYPKFNLSLVDVVKQGDEHYAIMDYVPGAFIHKIESVLYGEGFFGEHLDMASVYKDYLVATSDTSDIKRGGGALLSKESMALDGPTLKQDGKGYYVSYTLKIPLTFDTERSTYNHYYLKLEGGGAAKYNDYGYVNGNYFVELVFEKKANQITLSKESVLTDSFEHFPDEFNPLQKTPIRYKKMPLRSWFDNNYRDRLEWSTLRLENWKYKGKHFSDIMLQFYKNNGLYNEWVERCKKCNMELRENKMTKEQQIENCSFWYAPEGSL